MDTLENNTRKESSDELIKIDLQRWLFRLLSYWWLFLISMLIAGYFGYTYVKNATPLYSTSAMFLIKDAGSSGGISEGQILLQEGLTGGGKSMDNEIQILKSFTLAEKVVDKLKANISYIKEKSGKELYTNSPFVLDTFSFVGERPFGLSLLIEPIDSQQFRLKYVSAEVGDVYRFGQYFTDHAGSYKISRRPGTYIEQENYTIKITPKEFLAFSFNNRIAIQRIGSQHSSSVLSLEMTDAIPERARDLVNTLIEVYNEEEIADKNSVLVSTLDFIDERVGILTKELDVVEGGIERFKSKNEIITNDAASSRGFALGEIRGALENLSGMEVRKEILKSLEEMVRNDNGNSQLIPANLIADNPVLGGLVNQYNSTSLDRVRLSKAASAENPSLILMDQELADIRALILQTLKNLQRDLDIPMKRVERKINDLKDNLGSVPSIEKNLLEQMRMQSIKENLFLFLLQKREETALSEAVTSPNTRIIDPARTPKFPIFPQKRMIYMASAVLGFIIPLFLVTLFGFFETKIQSEDNIKDLTDIPILGRIAFAKKAEGLVVKQGSRSAVAEMFRLLRTNLNFLNVKKETQVLAVTSSVSGEGKSFVGLNLAMTIALSNKRVILLGLDLRKPKMHKYLGVENSKGLTNYLIRQAELEEVISISNENPNLSYITSGPIPPNPSELILSDRMDELITQLKEQYDYVIIDTPPIGLVSDALLLRKYVSNILLVVRQKYTKKAMVRDLNTLHQNGELKGAGLVFNGVKMGRSYYGYGGYNYGYGQGYYVDES